MRLGYTDTKPVIQYVYMYVYTTAECGQGQASVIVI